MWYMPYLRVRHAVLVYSYIAVGITLVAIALRFWPGAINPGSANLKELAAHTANIPLAAIISGATALVGGFATVLGLNLAAENDGHLELAWTKPISREGYALGVFAVDIAGMAAAIIVTTICGALIVDVFAGYQAVRSMSGSDVVEMLAYLGLPLLVYAWVTALSASMKRNRGAAAAIFWPLMIALAVLPLVPVAVIHGVATTLDLFNPLVLYSTKHADVQVGAASATVLGQLPTVWNFAWGWAVAATLLAVTLLQWRRLQL